uniref:Lactate/malate dehydrogenase C-terminal domain-containing protein n=1 Tax=Trichogramma kaykai TaxID=54128 RepID=A0ABD2WF28_9HYME
MSALAVYLICSAVWSSASVMNTKLKDFNAFIGTSQDSEAWNEHYDKYVRDASSVLTTKLGYHGWDSCLRLQNRRLRPAQYSVATASIDLHAAVIVLRSTEKSATAERKESSGKATRDSRFAEISTERQYENSSRVTVYVLQGCNHGFSDKNVFVSLPCIIGRTGVLTIVKQRYTVEEQTKLEQACSKILASIKKFVPELMN